MKRRYYLILFVLLFGAAMFGIVSTFNSLTTVPHTSSNTQGLGPDAAPVQKADDAIIVDTPIDGESVTSPLEIDGKAKGNWFFEGTFPITLTTGEGTVIAHGVAYAQGDWMSSDYIPFKANIAFTPPSAAVTSRIGYVVLKNDNPSGDSQFDKSVTIKVQW